MLVTVFFELKQKEKAINNKAYEISVIDGTVKMFNCFTHFSSFRKKLLVKVPCVFII